MKEIVESLKKYAQSEATILLTGESGTGKEVLAGYIRQNSSRSMDAFLSFLDSEAPDIASRLRSSGPANTGSRQGAMPDEWRAIAAEQPERFGSLQESFIRESHYDPAVAGITARTRLNMDELSPIMREVIWSTAVQHGPRGAVRIFEQADAATSGSGKKYERSLISHVYDIRSGQFGGHSEGIRASVQSRFKEEEAIALNMLDGAGSRTA